MNTQTLTNWKALPHMLLLVFTSVSMAGDKARSKLPTITDIAETTPGFGILYAALEAAGLDETFDGRRHSARPAVNHTKPLPTGRPGLSSPYTIRGDQAFKTLMKTNKQ